LARIEEFDSSIAQLDAQIPEDALCSAMTFWHSIREPYASMPSERYDSETFDMDSLADSE
jgi:hypothetical protein